MNIDSEAAARMEAKLAEYPRVLLLEGPTPLHHLKYLGDDMGIELWLKRDDLTSLMLGGDKARKLEFELSRAMAAGADVIVTSGSSQSNQARLAVSAARRLGLDAVVVLSRDKYTVLQGNLLLIRLMDAEVVLVDDVDHWGTEEHALAVCDRLRAEGRTPHYIPVSGTTPHSCLGYAVGALELARDLENEGVTPDYIYLPFGTGGIFASMLLAMRALGVESHFVGISVNRNLTIMNEMLNRWWDHLAALLDTNSSRGSYALYDEFVGSEYGDPTPATLDAIAAMAAGAGILTDPVYSGKVFAGLRHHRAVGMIESGSTVVMLHSGGVPAAFAYHTDLARHLGIAADP